MLKTIAGIPPGPMDLEVSSWRRVWRNFRVENLMGDIANFEGGKWCRWNPWSFRLELEATTGAKRLALDEGVVEGSQSCFLAEGKMIGKGFGRQLLPWTKRSESQPGRKRFCC